MRKTERGFALALALAAGFVAAPAFAQFVPDFFTSNVSLSCTHDEMAANGRDYFVTVKTGNRELIALCNGVDPDDIDAVQALVAEQTVVFDHVDHRVRVIDRCSYETICSWHFAPEHDEACANVHLGTFREGSISSVCTYALGDLEDSESEPIVNLHGTVFCNENESWNHLGQHNEHYFRNYCVGYFGWFDELDEHDFGNPCEVRVNSSGLYSAPTSCNEP